MSLFQTLFLLLSLLAIATVISKRAIPHSSTMQRLFWVFFWLFADLAVLFPDETTRIANRFGIGRGSDFVIYLSLALLFYLLFRLHLRLEGIKKEMTAVVRQQAIVKCKGNSNQ